MKLVSSLLLLILIALTIIGAGSAATTSTTTDATVAASFVSVSNIVVSPATFFEGDTGTVTVSITNNGDQTVPISHATIFDDNIQLISPSYDNVMNLGPGITMQYTFTVKAACPEGIYYPEFYLNFPGAGNLGYHFKVEVENFPLQVSILQKPDTFSANVQDTIILGIGNPRHGEVDSVSIVPRGYGISFDPSNAFIGILKSQAFVNESFGITATASTSCVFEVMYRNGANVHSVEITIPITIGFDKRGADLVVNNVGFSPSGSHFTLSGDVTNAGIEDAKSVVVTVTDPAVPVEPNRAYVVGSLKTDDFSSFEITFTARDMTSVPLLVQWKDTDGNLFEKNIVMNLQMADVSQNSALTGNSGTNTGAGTGGTSSSTTGQRGGGGFFVFGGGRSTSNGGLLSLPVIIAIIAAGCIGAGSFVWWRKRQKKKHKP